MLCGNGLVLAVECFERLNCFVSLHLKQIHCRICVSLLLEIKHIAGSRRKKKLQDLFLCHIICLNICTEIFSGDKMFFDE